MENLDIVVHEELCGVACCMGSGIVVLKYSVICFMPEIKWQNKNAFLFLNSI